MLQPIQSPGEPDRHRRRLDSVPPGFHPPGGTHPHPAGTVRVEHAHTIHGPRIPPALPQALAWFCLLLVAAFTVGWIVDPGWIPLGGYVAFLAIALAGVLINLIAYNQVTRDRG